MTLHRDPLKSEVGVRELHDRLSRYVQHVKDGGEVVVTMRGRRVARLVPVDDVDPLTDLRARGLIREPTAPRSPRARRARLKAAGPGVRARRRPTALIVYFDTSALVKLIFDEPGSELAVELWDRADILVSRASSSTPRHAQRKPQLLAGAGSTTRRTPARSPRSRSSTPSCAPSRSTNHWPARPATSPPNTPCAATTQSTSPAPCSCTATTFSSPRGTTPSTRPRARRANSLPTTTPSEPGARRVARAAERRQESRRKTKLRRANPMNPRAQALDLRSGNRRSESPRSQHPSGEPARPASARRRSCPASALSIRRCACCTAHATRSTHTSNGARTLNCIVARTRR
jgi:prevent-host-death family protein